MSSTLMALKTANESRLAEEKRQLERRRNIMTLILSHLTTHGYLDTAAALAAEAGGAALGRFVVADNIDLQQIVAEYESYHELRFGRRPKLVRRQGQTCPSSSGSTGSSSRWRTGSSSSARSTRRSGAS